MQLSEKSNCPFFIKLEKPHFGSISVLFGTKTLKLAVPLSEKLEIFNTLTFHKTFWSNFAPFWSKKPRTRFFWKNQSDTFLSMQKIRKFLQGVLQKNSRQTDKQTNVQGVIHRTLGFMKIGIHGSKKNLP